MANIEFFEEVFEPKFCEFLLRDCRRQLSSGSDFGRSSYHWKSTIVRASAPVLVRDYAPEQSAMILAQLIKRGVLPNDGFEVMNYAWPKLSYIPWHADGNHDLAATVYLNDVWDRDWGGIYLYIDDPAEGVRGVIPKFNFGLKNNTHLLHATTPVNLDADEPRFSLQIFPKSSSRRA